MRTHPLFFSAALCASFGALSAQCADNVYPIRLVDSLGVEAPLVGGARAFSDDGVFFAFDPSTPSGTYYVHVTTFIDFVGDAVLSANDPLDRFVQVTNTAGVITLALPFSTNPTPTFGVGLGGVGQSIPLTPLNSDPNQPCLFKAWMGDCWDLSQGPDNPLLIMGGTNPTTQQCCIRSYEYFTIGGPPGNDVCGLVFLDADGNGTQGAGENGVAGISVRLTGPSGSTTVQTGANGGYCFNGLGSGSYVIEVLASAPWVVTTPASVEVLVNGCADPDGPIFGIRQPTVVNDGHTPGFWRNKHGKELVTQYNILPQLPALCLVNATGAFVAPANVTQWAAWLQAGEATNMSYMLSIHVAAMYCNVVVGFVDENSLVAAGGTLGNISIADLLDLAVDSLCDHPYTPEGSPWRAEQEALKNALDDANNDLNWL